MLGTLPIIVPVLALRLGTFPHKLAQSKDETGMIYTKLWFRILIFLYLFSFVALPLFD